MRGRTAREASVTETAEPVGQVLRAPISPQTALSQLAEQQFDERTLAPFKNNKRR